MKQESIKIMNAMGRERTLPIRMQTIVSEVPPSKQVVDVGADHGLMSIALAARKDIGAVLATDLSAASLQKLRDRLPRLPKEQRKKIDTLVTDGLCHLPISHADTILIAGMGGALIERILRESPEIAEEASCWVVSPQSDVANFRRFLQRTRYRVEEELVEDEAVFYPIFRVTLSEPLEQDSPYARPFDDWEASYGPILLKKRHRVLLCQMERDRREYSHLLQQLEGRTGASAQKRRGELRQKLERLEEYR